MTAGFASFALVVIVAEALALFINRLALRLRVARRLRLACGTERGTEQSLAERSVEMRGRLSRGLGMLGGLMPLGEDDRKKIAVALARAGFGTGHAVAVVLGCKAACLLTGIGVGLVGVAPLLPSGLPTMFLWAGSLIAGLLIGVMLNLLPELIVARLGASRFRRIRQGLPDAVDLMIVCLESGLTFERTLQRTAADLKSFHRDLAGELRRASLDMSVHGRSREDALGRLAARLDGADFRDLATTVTQSERHGTPLAESLRKLAASSRVRTIAAMQAKLARLPVLLILPTIALVLPGIMVIVGGPSLVKLASSLPATGI